jgi:hypothetical protein
MRNQEVRPAHVALGDGSTPEGQALTGWLAKEFARVKAGIGDYLEGIWARGVKRIVGS